MSEAESVTGSGECSHDAFVSYQKTSSRRSARHLQRELERVARRSGHTLDIFRDETHLVYSHLGETLRRHLRGSRRLLVVLHSDTNESKWVDAEIDYWLTNGGSSDRLILVRADPDLNLGWDEEAAGFVNERKLPTSLHGVFSDEPLWFDLHEPRGLHPRGDDGSLARLCATLLEVDPEEILRREIAEQRRRQRRLSLTLAGVVVLAVLAASAAVLAVVNRNQAVAQRLEAEGQASAAQALLMADLRPDLAIGSAVRAAHNSPGNTTRSALWTVLERNSSVKLILPTSSALDNLVPTNVTFNAQGTRIFGQRDLGYRTLTVLWDAGTGGELGAGSVDDSIIDEPIFLNGSLVAVCTSDGLATAQFEEGRMNWLQLRDGSDCRLRRFTDGAIAQIHDGSAHVHGYVLNSAGELHDVGRVETISSDPLSDRALMRVPGDAYAAVTADGVVTRVPELDALRPRNPVHVDQWGRYIVQSAQGRWFRGAIVSDSGVERLPVPKRAVAALPLNSDSVEAAWITWNGWFQWSLNNQQVRVCARDGADVMFADLWISHDSQRAVAVCKDDYGTYAVALDIDSSFASSNVVRRVDEIEGTPAELSAAVRASKRGLALARHDDRSVIFNDLGVRLVEGRVGVDASGRGGLVVEAQGVAWVDFEDAELEPMTLDSAADFEAFSFNDDGSRLTVARPGGTVVVYDLRQRSSTLVSSRVSNNRASTALGEVVFTERRGALLAQHKGQDPDVVYSSTGASFIGRLTPSPDGAEVVGSVVSDGADEPEFVRVSATATSLLSEMCVTAESLEYLPGPNFETDVRDAEKPVLVGVNPSDTQPTVTNCTDGSEGSPDFVIMDYQMSSRLGRIVWWDSDTWPAAPVSVTTWARGDQSTLRTTQLPLSADHQIQFDDRNQVAVAWSGEDETVTILRSDGGEWRVDQTISTAVKVVSTAFPLADSGLLVVVGADGGIILYDLESSRLATRYVVRDDRGFRDRVEGVAVTTSATDLTVTIAEYWDETSWDDATYRDLSIPTDIPTLASRLCGLGPALEGCDGT